jgi:hypothetical protein
MMKRNRQTGWQKRLAILCMIIAASLLLVTSAMARPATKLAGELMQANQVTLNGVAVVSGVTVFSESRIKTAPAGAAVINLGRLGRISLGPDTEMTLRFSEEMIGGDLLSGRAILSAATGVKIALTMADGTLVSEGGPQPVVLSFEAAGGRSRIEALLGQARVASGRSIERVGGEVRSLVAPPRNNRSTIPLRPAGVFDPPCSSFPKEGIFGTRLQCRDYFNTRCLANPSRVGVCNPFR